jgi:phosphohistidine phosphatase SixA
LRLTLAPELHGLTSLPMLPNLARRILYWLLLLSGFIPALAAADEAVWQRLAAGGQVVLLRHATTVPGFGDPPGFRLGDCATQRKLSAAGREEARRIGAQLHARNIPVGKVRSSRWCRCLETAELVFGRAADPWPLLDSLHERPERRDTQTEALRRALAEVPARGNLFLVTHQANVIALTGTALAPGEMVVLTPRGDGRLETVGRISPSALARP